MIHRAVEDTPNPQDLLVEGVEHQVACDDDQPVSAEDLIGAVPCGGSKAELVRPPL
ncbi:MAG: hypothetical protein O2816_04515 [Planctomycetota bacterium]|nr:hypothetical protein [Planctomycetota bacterium]